MAGQQQCARRTDVDIGSSTGTAPTPSIRSFFSGFVGHWARARTLTGHRGVRGGDLRRPDRQASRTRTAWRAQAPWRRGNARELGDIWVHLVSSEGTWDHSTWPSHHAVRSCGRARPPCAGQQMRHRQTTAHPPSTITGIAGMGSSGENLGVRAIVMSMRASRLIRPWSTLMAARCSAADARSAGARYSCAGGQVWRDGTLAGAQSAQVWDLFW